MLLLQVFPALVLLRVRHGAVGAGERTGVEVLERVSRRQDDFVAVTQGAREAVVISVWRRPGRTPRRRSQVLPTTVQCTKLRVRMSRTVRSTHVHARNHPSIYIQYSHWRTFLTQFWLNILHQSSTHSQGAGLLRDVL